ncbi:VOC family protein [Hoeflea poritis]|uniref:VOC family protein n=1 Tax=Hoeflea poritis TaxID=2993659 RepID=A0ABT4VHG0_9HYPH|nr:VOC family protein [Hoeflea poritis]MDA4844138.1 VOC family protein [Hoeflea poritis]
MSDPSLRTFARHRLRVANAEELVDFYRDILGMRDFGSAEKPLLGYDRKQCLLEFEGGTPGTYTARADDLYWKIGITLRDLDHAVTYLKRQGVAVTEPRQFADIGYMSHMTDPAGFVIELLQQGFEGRAKAVGTGHAVGGQATLAHITLRINDIAAARADLEGRLGMRLISVQPVTEYGFCLYFFCWSGEPLPEPDLEAVANREWLWARPYTLLELQHVFAGNVRAPAVDGKEPGFAAFGWRDGSEIRYLGPEDMRNWL